ncbi:MAG TPA: restriction endonuclease, partial [Urbifossiella sp.]|nr:restriction endonuclease [Urbifossiella sp.]
MSPRDTERFVADIFRANYRHAEVVHVGKPGDLGIDVLFVDAGGNDGLVQVKRRETPGAVEGFDSLQRLLGALALEGKLRGIIVTTAGRLSRPLFKQRARAERRGFTIQLLDRGKLDRMLSPVLPVRPWLGLMGAGALSLVDDEVRRHFITNTSDPRQSEDVPIRGGVGGAGQLSGIRQGLFQDQGFRRILGGKRHRHRGLHSR